ncbi:hypothetical protein SAY87_010995 [Trapa incisa]|uniref:Uncharacterized protein n=2 Tax=Trapa TaxID=22665 RepID=A0AAN7MCD6_TRANT|nr:hypothetical protein SAY87_010995 [Trapa incisa]KAK4794303.1 hypothetical protein SAY86_012297 [Trapa natans]
MSERGKEASDASGSGLRKCDGEDGVGNQRRKKKGSHRGFASKLTRAKHLLHSSSSSSSPGNSSRRPTPFKERCTLCISRPRTSESPPESPTSDPNDSAFTPEMLRALMENNDFYSKECNTHFYADDLASCKRT